MALNIVRRSKTIVRHEYVIKSPACQGDIYKALTMAQNDRKSKKLSFTSDVVVWVESRDDEVVVYWTEEGEHKTGDPYYPQTGIMDCSSEENYDG